VFIDRQLAGPYGRNEAYYMMGPFQEGTKQQGSIRLHHSATLS
jgi:gluconate 2-dehydrogenase gamma chain